MQVKDALRQIVNESGKTHREIASEMQRGASFISVTLKNTSDPRAGTLAAIADACGYDLLLVDRKTKKKIALDPASKD